MDPNLEALYLTNHWSPCSAAGIYAIPVTSAIDCMQVSDKGMRISNTCIFGYTEDFQGITDILISYSLIAVYL